MPNPNAHYFDVDLLAWIEKQNLNWLPDILKHVDPFGQMNCASMLSQFKSDCMTYGLNNMLKCIDVLVDEQQQCQQIQEKEVSPMEEVEAIREGNIQEVDDEIECM